MGRPAEAEAEVAVVELEPVAGADVGAVVGQQRAVERGRVDLDLGPEPHQADARRRDGRIHSKVSWPAIQRVDDVQAARGRRP